MKNRHLAYFALAGAALIWGASMPLVKPALAFVSPFQFLLLRYALASPFVIPIIAKTIRDGKITLKMLPKIVALEVLSLLNLVLVYAALEYNTAIQQSLIMDVRPLFITMGGILVLKEVEERHEWIGLLIALLGTVLVILAPMLSGNGQTVQFSLPGIVILMTTHLIATLLTVTVKRYYHFIPKTGIAGIHVWVGFLLFALINTFNGSIPTIETFLIPEVFVPVTYMAVFGTMVGLSLQLYGYDKIEASEATLFSYLQPLVYIPLSLILLNETVHPFQLIGIAIIALGVFLAEQRKKFRFFKKLDPNVRIAHKVTHYR